MCIRRLELQGVCMASASEVAAAAAATAAAEAAAKSMDYEYDDDEFDMEAEMLRREFREASLLANGDGVSVCGPATVNPAVLEPSSQTQVDLTVDRRPTASAAVQPAPHQLQPAAAADHSSGGSSSVDSRVADMAYAYGNQSEYTAEDVPNKHCGKAFTGVKSAAMASSATAVTVNNNNDDEYLVEQRLLGNGADGGGGGCTGNRNSPELPPSNADNNCSQEDRGLAPATAAAATATVSQ